MLTRTAVPALAQVALLVSLVALLSGCTGSSPGTDPQVRQRFDVLQERISDLQNDLDDNRQALLGLTDELETLNARGPGGSGGDAEELASLRSTDQQIQQLISDLNEQLSQLAADVRELRVDASSAIIARAESPARTATSAAAPAPAAEPTVRPVAASRGTWHTLGESEELAEVANRHGTTVSALLEANGLPRNAHVYPRQQLFIPQ